MLRTLDLPSEQAELLRDLARQVDQANERLALAFTVVVRGHGITQASAPTMNGNQLSLTVPED